MIAVSGRTFVRPPSPDMSSSFRLTDIFSSACTCAIIRTVYLVRLLRSQDAPYYVGIMVLWGFGEMTAGFLVLGIPSIPKVASKLHCAHHFGSLVRPWKSSRGTESSHSHVSLPGPVPRKPRDQWQINDLEKHGSGPRIYLNPIRSGGQEDSKQNVVHGGPSAS